MFFYTNLIFLAQVNEYLFSTVDTDGMVLQHQGISTYSAEYAVRTRAFPVVYGLILYVLWCVPKCKLNKFITYLLDQPLISPYPSRVPHDAPYMVQIKW